MIDVFNQELDEMDPGFQDYLNSQNLCVKDKLLWNFHKWMRNKTDLSSGTIVDYRKYIAEMLNDDGDLVVERRDLDSGHKKGALSKFQEYENFLNNKEKSTGDDTK